MKFYSQLIVPDCYSLAELETDVASKTIALRELSEECDRLERLSAAHRQRVSIYEQLEQMGFDLKKLRRLSDTIKELASESKISEKIASEMVFADLAKKLEQKMTDGRKSRNVSSEMDKLRMEVNDLKKTISSRNDVALSKSIPINSEEAQILGLAMTLEASPIDNDTLLSELNLYGSLKNVIKKLREEVEKLERERDHLRVDAQLMNDPLFRETMKLQAIKRTFRLKDPVVVFQGQPEQKSNL